MTTPSTPATGLTDAPRWDSVAVGQRIGSDDRLVDWQDVMLQISGSQDWNRVHYDHQFAIDSGHRDVFFNTGWTSAMLGKVLTDWCGATGWLSELEFQMRRMIAPGDTVRAGAEVIGKRIDDDGRRLVEMKVWLQTEREGVTTRGHAIVTLPR